jgi:predicted transcriptional regulator
VAVLESSQTCYKNNTAKNDTAESNMSPTAAHTSLTKRERLIMDALYQLGRATAAEVLARLPGSPSSSTVRTQLRVLERKGYVRHEEAGLRYVYLPAVPRRAARKSALRHLVDTFFDGSAEKVVGALLGGDGARISDEELERIAALVEKARKEASR